MKGRNKEFLVLLMAVAIIVVIGKGSVLAQAEQLNVVKPPIADRDLVIEISEITENATFYPVDIEGTRIEVLAVKAPDGTIRTAFNTCQACYGSGRAFFQQTGTVLVCQNCNQRFRMGQVGVRAGGCNPAPIFPQDTKISDTTITIPKEFLKEAKMVFARWKRG